jgi:hypothetical protein
MIRRCCLHEKGKGGNNECSGEVHPVRGEIGWEPGFRKVMVDGHTMMSILFGNGQVLLATAAQSQDCS